jgi:hypothetical protein
MRPGGSCSIATVLWKFIRSSYANRLSRDPAKFNQIMAEVEELFLRCIAVSVAVVMRKDDYDEFYKPTQPRGGQKRSQLGVLYQALVSFAASFLESFPPENLESLDFIYERVSNPGGFQTIHDEFKNHGDVSPWFGPLTVPEPIGDQSFASLRPPERNHVSWPRFEIGHYRSQLRPQNDLAGAVSRA